METPFKPLFSSRGKHREVIEALMRKSERVQRKELAKVASVGDGKSLTTALEELCECGFVRAYGIVLFEVKSEGLFLA